MASQEPLKEMLFIITGSDKTTPLLRFDGATVTIR
jgi:hypothetical protein